MNDSKNQWKLSEFIFDYGNLLYYECHKINLNCGRSYTDSLEWIKNKHESQKKVCENKDFCNIVMPFEYTKIKK